MSLQDIITAIRKLFGIEPTVESITKPFTKVADKLDKHAAKQARAAGAHNTAAAKLVAQAEAEKAEAARAAAAREKVASLIH